MIGLLRRRFKSAETSAFCVVYDNDGFNPPVPSRVSDAGGVVWPVDPCADDIIGFNPEKDELDFGEAVAQRIVLSKTPDGEPVIDDLWGPDMQILQGVCLADLPIECFGKVGIERLRQDLGGILSWEKGIGPRETGTVYIRSHEYGASETIEDFDPQRQKISFLYFGARESLSVEDAPAGMTISALPSGQSFTFVGVSSADLVAANLEFARDQVLEDDMAAPFGALVDAVSIVSREGLVMPQAPEKKEAVACPLSEEREPALSVVASGDNRPAVAPLVSGDPDSSDVIGGPTVEAGATGRPDWEWGREFVALSDNPALDILDFRAPELPSVPIKPVLCKAQIASRTRVKRRKKGRGKDGMAEKKTDFDKIDTLM